MAFIRDICHICHGNFPSAAGVRPEFGRLGAVAGLGHLRGQPQYALAVALARCGLLIAEQQDREDV